MTQASESTSRSSVPRPMALRLIGALRNGSNSLEGVSLFSAGREPVMRAAETLMDELAISGGSAVRWLKGNYGSGKTHTFARLLEAAHTRRWVVSYVQVSGRGQGCELHRFEEVYSAIVRNCISPEQAIATEVLTTPGAQNGWQWLLDQWVDGLKRQTGSREGGDVAWLRFNESVETTVSMLRRQHGIQGAFGAALREYAKSHIEREMEWQDVLLDWFSGSDVFQRGPELKAKLRAAGVLETVSRRNAKAMLRQLTAFVRYRGYRGVLILLDEVENVLQLTPSNRRTAYTLLRELIDNVDERHGMAQTLVYASGTPDLFESEKGIAEYEALASRVILPSPHATPNPASAVVDLAAFPIERQDFITIAMRIGKLYEAAGHIQRLEARVDPSTFESLLTGNLLPSPRNWVRTVVDFLDRMRA